MVISDRTAEIRTVSVESAMRDLRAAITRLERVYEMSSEDMLAAVRSGMRNDTAEIARWMVLYQELQYLAA